jgi:hypothetical protein
VELQSQAAKEQWQGLVAAESSDGPGGRNWKTVEQQKAIALLGRKAEENNRNLSGERELGNLEIEWNGAGEN